MVETGGKVSKAAEAVFRTLAYAPGRGWLLWIYQWIPGFRPLSEWFYRLVAHNRITFSHATRFLWGEHLEPSTFRISTWIFLRLLGVIYFIAFASFGSQALGLVGSNGILPAKTFLAAVSQRFGPERYWLVPTLGWLNSSDVFIQFLWIAGLLFSLFVILGFLEAPALFLSWLFYLSVVTLGQDFMEFQWDILLLEVGFLAVFLASLEMFPRSCRRSPPSRTILWLFRWLLFRLMFRSGFLKLASGDPVWHHLTALNFHYETQPLPTWIGWYAHQLPHGFQKLSVWVMFGIELFIPFLIFASRRFRHFASTVLMAFQVLILLTGNYCFFNLLTIALCILLWDDAAWPLSWQNRLIPSKAKITESRLVSWPKWVIAPVTALIVLVSLPQMARVSRISIPWPAPVILLQDWLAPFRSVNSYGLFAVMTTERREIIVEGSNDGQTWYEYQFKWKPGDLDERPRFVAPHQPRLDWQMWFAALSSWRYNPWFMNFMERLLQGSPEVLSLLAHNPFPDHPPRYLRAVVYDYHFTDFAMRRVEGRWWRRQFLGPYAPVLSRTSFSSRS